MVVPTPAFLTATATRSGRSPARAARPAPSAAPTTSPGSRAPPARSSAESRFFSFTSLGIEGQAAQDAIDVTTVGLYLAAAVALLTALIGIGIALSREVALGDAQQLTLSALGMRPRHRTMAAAAVIGVPVAILGRGARGRRPQSWPRPSSPSASRTKAEPDPGIRVDPRRDRSRPGSRRGCGAGDRAGRRRPYRACHQAGPGVRRPRRWPSRMMEQSGLHAPDGGRDRVRVGPRSPASRAPGALVAVRRGVRRTRHRGGPRVLGRARPSRDHAGRAFGWTWDLAPTTTRRRRRAKATAARSPRRTRSVDGISDVASVCNGSVEVAGDPSTGWGFVHIRGRIGPAIVDGRAPRADDEVVARRRHARGSPPVGRRRRSRRRRRWQAAGCASSVRPRSRACPTHSRSPTAPRSPARALNRLGANGGLEHRRARRARRRPRRRRARSSRRRRAVAARSRSQCRPRSTGCSRSMSCRSRSAAFVAVVALVAVGLGLVTSVRRRRRDLAVLKTLGFTRAAGARPQSPGRPAPSPRWVCSSGSRWACSSGGFVWRRVADELGVSSDPTWPALAVLLLVPAASLSPSTSSPQCPRAVPHARAPPSSYDRSDVVTSLDDVKPLELASIRDDVRERPPWSSRATASVVLAVDRARRRRDRGARRRPGAARARSGAQRGAGRGRGPLAAVFVARAPPTRSAGRDHGVGGDGRRARASSARRWPGATSRPTPCATSVPGCVASRSRSSPRSGSTWRSGSPTARCARVPGGSGAPRATWPARSSRCTC